MRLTRILAMVFAVLSAFFSAGAQEHPLRKAEVGDYAVFEGRSTLKFPELELDHKEVLRVKLILADQNENDATLVTEIIEAGTIRERTKAVISLQEPFTVLEHTLRLHEISNHLTHQGRKKITVPSGEYDCEVYSFHVPDTDVVSSFPDMFFPFQYTIEEYYYSATAPLWGLVRMHCEAFPRGKNVCSNDFVLVETGKGLTVPDMDAIPLEDDREVE